MTKRITSVLAAGIVAAGCASALTATVASAPTATAAGCSTYAYDVNQRTGVYAYNTNSRNEPQLSGLIRMKEVGQRVTGIPNAAYPQYVIVYVHTAEAGRTTGDMRRDKLTLRGCA